MPIFLFGINNSYAQGISQVTVVGIPPILNTPLISDLENNFNNGMYSVHFSYTNTNQAAVNFIFHLVVERGGVDLIDIKSDPKSFTPGIYVFSSFFDDIHFPYSVNEILKQAGSQLEKQIIQGGTIPEGDYMIKIEATPQDQTLSVIPGIADFVVIYPQPPILISPSDNSDVIQNIPTFAWNPVVTPNGASIEYNLLLVQILANQTPLQAINSNRATANIKLMNQNIYSYTPDNLPLEKNKRYVWEVKVKDANGVIPFKNNGKSEIYTFTYKKQTKGGGTGSIADIKSIPLVPGFAALVDLGDLKFNDQGTYYSATGHASLQFKMPGMIKGKSIVQVYVENLMIQKGSPANPVLLGGQVSGDALPGLKALDKLKKLIKVNGLRWKFGQGFSVSTEFIDSKGSSHTPTGSLKLTPQGLQGNLTFSPLLKFSSTTSDSPVTFGIKTLNFSTNGLKGSGSVMLSDKINLAKANFVYDGKEFVIYINSNAKSSIALVNGSNKVLLNLTNSNGEVKYNFNTKQFDYNINLNGLIKIQIISGSAFGFIVNMNLDSKNGFSLKNSTSFSKITVPKMDLGAVEMQLSNLSLSKLSFNSSTNHWDFKIKFDANFNLPTFSNVILPKIAGIVLTPIGYTFPAVNLTKKDLQNLPDLNIGGFGLKLNKFSMGSFSFPWFIWNGNDSGPWDFKLSFSLGFPNFPKDFSQNLKSKKIEIKDAEFKHGSLVANLNSNLTGKYEIPLGDKNKLMVNKIAGNITFKFAKPKSKITSNITLVGNLVLASPFSCNGNRITMKSTSVKLLSSGIVEGSVKNLPMDCKVKIGPYSASITTANLTFGEKNNKQTAIFDASANLKLSNSQIVSGSVKIDLMTNKLVSYEFDIDKPFTWKIPNDNPVLVFNIQKAKISQDGLFIDGRETLQVGKTTIGATFDNLLLDLSDFSVKSGKVTLDSDFAFEAGINSQTNALSFKAVKSGSKLTMNPGLLMELNGTLTIDTLGLHSSGSANAELNFSSYKLNSLKATYVNDFTFGLKPFGVKEGRVNFSLGGQRIAWEDPSGFHADPSFFINALIPNRLPLPVESFAYIQLRQNRTLLVNFVRQNNGNIKISTKANHQVDIVFPGLQGNNAQPPTIAVTFSDLVINPTSGVIISGSISADVNANNPLSDLSGLGIPLSLQSIFYGEQTVNGNSITTMFLKGKLKLFSTKLGQNDNDDVSLYYDNGHVIGDIALNNLLSSIPLIDNNQVQLKVSSVSGSIDVPVLHAGNVNSNLILSGSFNVMNNESKVAASVNVNLEYTQSQLTIKRFDASSSISGKKIKIGNYFSFKVDKINNLSLSYDKSTGFTFDAGLDFTMNALFGQNEEISVPLKNIELKSDVGIVIPQQNINDGTTPSFSSPPPAFDLGIFHLKLLALRVKANTLSWNMLSLNTALNLIPKFDFELTFPSLKNTSPKLADATITLSDVGFDKGVFTGTVVPYTFSGDGVLLPIESSGTGIYVKKVSGGLIANQDGSQGYNINLNGSFKLPDYFATDTPCNNNSITVQLTSEGGLKGTINDFAPCGKIKLDALSLSFSNSKLSFAFSNNTQSLLLSGTATAAIQGSNNQTLTANGTLDFDVLNDKILSGSLGLTGPFTWKFPNEKNPIFAFTVQSAKIDNHGFVFTGNGSFKTDNSASVNVNFNQLALNLKTGNINSGNIEILNSFAFDIGISPLQWSVANPASNFNLSTGIRLNIPKNLTIDKNGLTINGTSSAILKYAGKDHTGLSADFKNFILGFNSFGVSSGEADLNLNEQGKKPVRLAYYDKNGFHLDKIAGALPDTLGLPTKDIAYIVLKDANGKSLVSSSTSQGVFKIWTKTNSKLKLVLASLKNGNAAAPSVDVTFSDVEINSSAQVTRGIITVSSIYDKSLIDLSGLGYSYPLKITKLQYAKNSSGSYLFSASAEVVLPQALNSVKVTIKNIEFNSNGFKEMTFKAGEYTTTHTEDTTSLVTKYFHKGAFIFKVNGAEITFGQTNTFKISGDIESNLFKKTVNNSDQYSILHYSADYTNKKWAFTVDYQPNEILNLGKVEFLLENITPNFNETNFGLDINGQFKAPDLLGPDFAVELDGLHIGTDGIIMPTVTISKSNPYATSLFGGKVKLTIDSIGVSYLRKVLSLSMKGSMTFLTKTFKFAGMKIGTDGSFVSGSGKLGLINSPINLLHTYLVLDTLNIDVVNNQIKLSAYTKASLPYFDKKAYAKISIDKAGNVTTPGITFTNFKPHNIPYVGNIKVTELGLDLSTWSNIKLFASVDVHLNKPPGGTGTDTISFGISNYKSSDAGFTYSKKDGLKWKNIHVSKNLEFGLKAFNVDSVGATLFNNTALDIEISGNAHLNLPGIVGSISFTSMRITPKGIKSYGHFTGGSLSTLSGKITITVHTIKYGSGDTTLTFKEQRGTKKNPGTIKITVPHVKQYFIMGPAVLSIGGNKDKNKTAFTGGIKKIIYYRTKDGSMFLNIEHASLTLPKSVSVDISMKYTSGKNYYSFMVAGKAKFRSTEFDAMGEIADSSGNFRLGIFIKAKLSTPIPIIPSVIQLTAVGGGFFINPNAHDFNTVVNLVNDTIQNPDTWNHETTSKPYFAVVLYAEVGIIGTTEGGVGTYVLKGQTLIIITDKFFHMDLTASYTVIQKAGIGYVRGGMSLDITFGTDQAPFSITAIMNLNVDLKSVVTGNAKFNFSATKNSTGAIVWGLTGNAKFKILIVQAEVNLSASKQGFYFQCAVGGRLHYSVLTISAGLNVEVFYYKPDRLFGAYAEAHARATAYGVGLGIIIKGALIIQNSNFLIYFNGTAVVYFFGKHTAEVYASIDNSGFDAGLGHDAAREKLIADARKEAQNINQQITKTIKKLHAVESLPKIHEIDYGTLVKSGYHLHMEEYNFEREDFGRSILGNESKISPRSLSIVFTEINDNIISAPHPDNSSLGIHPSDALDYATSVATNVIPHLEAIHAYEIKSEEKAATIINNLSSPVTHVKKDWGPNNKPPTFSINKSIEDANVSSISSYRKNISKMNEEYIAAIDTLSSNIQKVNLALNGKVINYKINFTVNSNKIQNPTMRGPDGRDRSLFNASAGGHQLNVNDVAEAFVKASEKVNDYYGNSISFVWEMKHWANNTLSYMVHNSIRPRVNTALLSELKSFGITYIPGSNSTAKVIIAGIIFNGTNTYGSLSRTQKKKVNKAVHNIDNDIIDFISKRKLYLYQENPDTSDYAADISNSYSEKLQGYVNDKDYLSFAKSFYDVGMNLWYDMNYDGLKEITSSSYVNTLKTNYNNIKSGLDNAHEGLTKIEDQIYNTKLNMLITLYGMIDNYKVLLTTVGKDTSLISYIENQKKSIETEMEAPQITKITVSKSLKGFDNTVNVNWDVSHPTGNIAEVSYKILRGTSNSIYSSGLQSAGDLTGLNFDAFKENQNDLSHNYRFILRARGPAGNTVSRVATFSVPIAASNGGPGTGSSGSTDNNVLTADNTPPAKPVLTGLPYSYSSKTSLTQASKFSTPTMTTVKTYWTDVDDKIELGNVMSYDPQSDIASFAFAIGKFKGDTSVVGWHDIQGKRILNNNSSGKTNIIQKITINDVLMNTGKLYFVSLKAKNGAGLYSKVLNIDAISYDPTPPSKPDSLSNGIKSLNRFIPTLGFLFGSSAPSSQAEIYSVPKMDLPPTNKTMTEPMAKVQWGKASDAQSGIKEYEYAFDHQGNAKNAFKNPDNIHFTQNAHVEIDGEPLSYSTPVYVHIRAVNNAGLHSKVLTYGPYTATDVSAPTEPTVAAMIMPGIVQLYIIRPSYDLESGIDYVQYAIGTTAGGTDIVDFPSSGSNLQNQRLYKIPEWRSQVEQQKGWDPKNALAYNIPVTNLPVNKNLYISYRAVNKQGKVSDKAVTGPVILDNTPPEIPGLQITSTFYSSTNQTSIKIVLSNVYDPESGIAKVEYEIRSKPFAGYYWATLVNWSDLVNNGIEKNKRNYTRVVNIPGNTNNSDFFKVGIRVTNGNGRQSVVWVTHSPPAQHLTINSKNQNLNFHF